MKRIWFAGAVGAVICALLVLDSGLVGQVKKGPPPGKGAKGGPPKDGPFKGKGFGGGFERPLAKEPRRGNPGASPSLTQADFRDLVAHAKDFDANKDGKLTKAELPEMFAVFFDRADSNSDGFLDSAEMARVLGSAAASSSSTSAPGKGAPKAP